MAKEREIHMYPRKDKDKLVADNQMVGYREHLSHKNRMIFLTGPISDEQGWGATESCNLFMALASVSKEPIKMVVTSPGGFLDPTYLLCDTIEACGVPVYTLGRFVCSAAVLPFVCGTKRYLLPHARVMLHLPSAVFAGDSAELNIQHKEMEKGQEQLISFLQSHGVKRTQEQILSDIDRSFWMNPKEAIEYGLADEVMTKEVMKEWLS